MPVFDIYCPACKKRLETAGEVDSLKCPVCGSDDVERLWTGKPTIRMKGAIDGETSGTRAYARELTRKLSH